MSVKKAGLLFIVAGALLVAGSSVAILNTVSSFPESSEFNKEIIQEMKENFHSPQPTPIASPAPDLETEAPQTTEDPPPAPAPMPQQTPAPSIFNDRDCIGMLSIPEINLEIPVLREYSDANLNLAPCLYTGSISDDNAVIVGHNYRQHFGQLKKIKIGSDVFFSSFSGVRRVYKVIGAETLSPNETEQMITGDWDLTLFTCTNSGLSRLTIRCRSAA